MKFLKIALLSLLSLILVNKNYCVPISDKNEVLEYLQHFGYLSENDKNKISNDHESLEDDDQFITAIKHLQRNANIPITGKYDDNTEALMKIPRCGVSDKKLNSKHHKRYALMPSKWSSSNITYRFVHMNKEKYIKDENNIRRIIREAFNVWEKDTVLKFAEIKEHVPNILISFQHSKHSNNDFHILNNKAFGYAFRPGKGKGGDIHLNENMDWDFKISHDSEPEDGKISLFAVMLHEIGHSLGLDHTHNKDTLMYPFNSRSTSSLSKDDINGVNFIYGTPGGQMEDRLSLNQQDDEEEHHVDRVLPDKCNTSYDAIAAIDNEIIAFKGRFMFSKKIKLSHIRHRWSQLSPKMTRVDAVYQTTDGRTLFFIGQAVYSFVGKKFEKVVNLSDLGIDSSVLKIDVIFRKPDSQRTYIFIGEDYYRFDEHKMMITGYSNKILKVFRDVYDMDTAFTYENVTYFFKNEHYYEFLNRNWMLERMSPGLSANQFMNCSLEYDYVEYEDDNVGINSEHEPDLENPEIDFSGYHNVASLKKISFALLVLGIPRIFG